MTVQERLELADWRRSIAEMYAELRRVAVENPNAAWNGFRATRDALFASHPQSPLDEERKAAFTALHYFDYDPRWRIRAKVQGTGEATSSPTPRSVTVELPEGTLRYRAVGTAVFTTPATDDRVCTLTLYWLDGYGGGLFLPFKDLTSGRETYGGGRYLYDTIKGADIGAGSGPDELVLDFNFAYNPSCAYSPRWVCPLSPSENSLPFRIEAGESESR